MTDKPTNPDYVAHGSDRHAAHLGLVKAAKEDVPQMDGWALADITMWGPSATPEFLMQILKQKINELTIAPIVPQSDDPLAPNYAPPMWTPYGGPVSGTV